MILTNPIPSIAEKNHKIFKNFMLKDLDLNDQGILKIMKELKPKKQNKIEKKSEFVWTEDEDNQLCDLIQKYGEKCWRPISESFIKKKKVRDCKERWFCFLKQTRKINILNSQSYSSSLKLKKQKSDDKLNNNIQKKIKIENIFSSSTFSNSSNLTKNKTLTIIFPLMEVSQKNEIDSSEITLQKIKKTLELSN